MSISENIFIHPQNYIYFSEQILRLVNISRGVFSHEFWQIDKMVFDLKNKEHFAIDDHTNIAVNDIKARHDR